MTDVYCPYKSVLGVLRATPRTQIWDTGGKTLGYKSIGTCSRDTKGDAAGIGGSLCFQPRSMALIKEGFCL